VRVAVRSEDAMFHEWVYSHVSARLTGWLAVVAFVRGKGLQLTCVPAGELHTHVRVASFSGGRTMHVQNRLRLCIDEFCRFDNLNAVVRAVAVVFARW